MNINCIICSDLFLPNSEIYVTKCGHMFHYLCLVQWIERSYTCPQCRSRVTEKTIHRVFCNIVNNDNIVEDAVTLQSKLDNLNLQLRLKDQEMNNAKKQIQQINQDYFDTLTQLERISVKLTKCDSNIVLMKEQLAYYKDKAKNEEMLYKEIKLMKEKLTYAKHVTKALTGTFDDVQEVLNECQCPKTLSSIVTSLKKELQHMEKKRNSIFSSLKRKENELHSFKKENEQIKDENAHLKAELKAHQECKEQMQFLKNKIAEIVSKESAINPNLARLINESPVPALTKPTSKLELNNEHLEFIDSPSVADRIISIKKSSSPYLQLKTSSVNLLLKTPITGQRLNNTNSSIFKKSISNESEIKEKQKPGGEFDGFGGYSKDDIFPSPKLGGIKRYKSSTISANKFRKLAKPNKKLDDFLDTTDTE